MNKVFLFFLSLFLSLSAIPEKRIVVVVPGYNNINWYEANINSILMQKYKNYRVIFIDDASKDNTGIAAKQFVKTFKVESRTFFFDDKNSTDINEVTTRFKEAVNQERRFFTIVRNLKRAGALANLYRAIQSCDDDEIIVTLDMDDWFQHDQVLKDVNEAYSSGEVWLTHGTLMSYPAGDVTWSEPVPDYIVQKNTFRSFKCPSHLRTFYAWLFKKIKLEDLLYEGKFYPMTWDMAMMYPMIEMAGTRHRYLSKVNYVYNMANQINDNKVNADLQNELDRQIRSKEPYKPLVSK